MKDALLFARFIARECGYYQQGMVYYKDKLYFLDHEKLANVNVGTAKDLYNLYLQDI